MSNDVDIDQLLKQDEAELRAKKKRLKTFANALDELRSATKKTAESAQEIVDQGDLTRAEFAKVFALSKSERASLFPPLRRSSTKATDDASDTEIRSNAADSDSFDDDSNEEDNTA